MKFFLISAFLIGCAFAAPYGGKTEVKVSTPSVAILKHIQKMNEDGSYTFGYESADGSYRVENRDTNGYITGKFGYIDAYGKLQETEYVAGKLSGRSVGYQARSDQIPIFSREQLTSFPIVRNSVSTAEQRALDYEYNSVDEDEDGMPDQAPVVRIATPVVTTVKTYESAPAVAVRVVEDSPKSSSYADVRVSTETKQSTSPSYSSKVVTQLRETLPAKSETYQVEEVTTAETGSSSSSDSVITEIRVADIPAADTVKTVEVVEVAEPVVADVSKVSSTKSVYDTAPAVVRVVETVPRVQYVQKSTPVHLVVTKEESSAKAVETVPVKEKAQIYKVNQSVFRVPVYDEAVQPVVKQQQKQYVEKKTVTSTGRLDAYLRQLVSNKNVKVAYEQPRVQKSYYYQPTVSNVETNPVDDSIDIDAFEFGRII